MVLASHNPAFPCVRAIQAVRNQPRPAMQTLYGTFGRSWRCQRRFAHRFRDRPHLIAVNVLNGPNRRRQRLFQGELAPRQNIGQFNQNVKRRIRLLGAYERRVDRIYNRMAAIENENTSFRIYPELEDNLDDRAFNVLANASWRRQDVEIWRSAFRTTGGGWDGIELHGFGRVLNQLAEYSGECSWSNDGIGILTDRAIRGLSYAKVPEVRGAVERLRKYHCDVFLWRFGWQGIEGPNFVRPDRRRFEFPRSDIILIRQLLR